MCISNTCFSLAISSWSRVAASPLKEKNKVQCDLCHGSVRNNPTGSEGTDTGVALALPEGLTTVKGCSLFSLSFCSKFFTFSSSFNLSDSSDFTTDCRVFAEAFSPRSTVIWKSCLTTLGPSSTKPEHQGQGPWSKGWTVTKTTCQESPGSAQASEDLMLRFNYATWKKNDQPALQEPAHKASGCNLIEIGNHPFLIYLMSEFFQFLIFLCDQGTSNIDGFL